MNTNARNLLGLVYFEMGESVKALSEWVISKSLQERIIRQPLIWQISRKVLPVWTT